ncbi:Hypp4822 [Branchiostoma lanceolatum]|uniref:Hypp4822 protein n=1 Tax=Branchiostoma lanceolatum TaxID=7740 RepID=A0A8K0EZJ2_BRALA|nr:Hypp4822 [Branchiostoma lanceolatum]
MLSHTDHHGQSNVAYYTQDWRPNQLPPPPAAQDYHHHHHPHSYHQSGAGYSFQTEPGYISRVNTCTWPGFVRSEVANASRVQCEGVRPPFNKTVIALRPRIQVRYELVKVK